FQAGREWQVNAGVLDHALRLCRLRGTTARGGIRAERKQADRPGLGDSRLRRRQQREARFLESLAAAHDVRQGRRTGGLSPDAAGTAIPQVRGELEFPGDRYGPAGGGLPRRDYGQGDFVEVEFRRWEQLDGAAPHPPVRQGRRLHGHAGGGRSRGQVEPREDLGRRGEMKMRTATLLLLPYVRREEAGALESAHGRAPAGCLSRWQ